MNRKNFFKTCAFYGLAISGTLALIESCSKNNTSTTPQGPTVNFTLDLGQPANAALNAPGGSVASHGVVVANSAGNYICVAQSCTHNGCSVGYNQSGNDFVCPCHGGTFDTNGNVTSGPPPAPLKKYTVTKNGSILTIAG
jgi:cytochrome b6-f complex iron-sulfur subunit